MTNLQKAIKGLNGILKSCDMTVEGDVSVYNALVVIKSLLESDEEGEG